MKNLKRNHRRRFITTFSSSMPFLTVKSTNDTYHTVNMDRTYCQRSRTGQPGNHILHNRSYTKSSNYRKTNSIANLTDNGKKGEKIIKKGKIIIIEESAHRLRSQINRSINQLENDEDRRRSESQIRITVEF